MTLSDNFSTSLSLPNPFSTLTLSVPGKLENSIFEIPVLPRILNINVRLMLEFLESDCLRCFVGFEWFLVFLICLTLSVPEKYIIEKFIKYSLKKLPVKSMFTLTVIEILLFEG